AVGHSEDDHTTFSIREAGGILHRDLHVVLRTLPGLEVEPLALEVVGGQRLQPIEEGEDFVVGRDAHLPCRARSRNLQANPIYLSYLPQGSIEVSGETVIRDLAGASLEKLRNLRA